MRLNELKPVEGSRFASKRLGRGLGSGLGKTAGRGHKGQHSRSGGKVKPGFEGGQMPLQRRLPKFGFTSRKSLVSKEVRLGELNLIDVDVVDLAALKTAGLVRKDTLHVKVVLSGEINRAVTLKGIAATKGAAEAIKAAGGAIEE